MRHHRLGLFSAALVFVIAPAWAAQGAGSTGEPVVVVNDPRITESSGLVAREGQFLTVNDAGNAGEIFVIDAQSGDTLGTTFWADAPEDVEALAPGSDDSVWVGDIGDNKQERKSIEVTQVSVGATDQVQAGSTYPLAYRDGPHDAETLLVHPQTQQIMIVTKDRTGGSLFAAPEKLQPNRPGQLTKIADVARFVTDGAFFPSGEHFILRGYGRGYVYTYPDIELVGTFRLPKQEQGEGIAIDTNNEVYLSSEGINQPVVRVNLPPHIQSKLATDEPTQSADPEPTEGPDNPATADSDTDAGSSTTTALIVGAVVIIAALAYALWTFTRRRTKASTSGSA